MRRAKEESHREAKKRALEQHGPTKALAIGDYVLLERPPRTAPKVVSSQDSEDALSRKFALKFYDEVYVVADLRGHGDQPKAALLATLDGAIVDKFANPVSIKRLQPLHFRILSEPISEPRELLLHRPSGRVRAAVKNVLVDGQVEIETDTGRQEIVDLTKEQYEWQLHAA